MHCVRAGKAILGPWDKIPSYLCLVVSKIRGSDWTLRLRVTGRVTRRGLGLGRVLGELLSHKS